MPHALICLITVSYLVALGAVAWSDLATRMVPNSATLLVAILGVITRIAGGPEAVLVSAAISAVLFLFLVFLHHRGILGGGDVKLIAAAALGLSPVGTLHLVTAIALSGGVLALLHLSLRHLPHPAPCHPGAPVLARVWTIERWRIRRHGSLPYAVAVAAGAAWVLLANFGS